MIPCPKHINNRSDFAVKIRFQTPDGAPRALPETPFRMVFSTAGGNVTYNINSADTKHCRRIGDSNSELAIFFDFSRHPYFRNGELLCTFIFSDENDYFFDGLLNTRIPINTGYVIWDGATDFSDYVSIELVTSYEKPVLQFSSAFEFPNIGSTYTLYVDRGANKAYRWDAENRQYYCIASDYNDIEIIDSGNAAGLGEKQE